VYHIGAEILSTWGVYRQVDTEICAAPGRGRALYYAYPIEARLSRRYSTHPRDNAHERRRGVSHGHQGFHSPPADNIARERDPTQQQSPTIARYRFD
jgi:hypothetical protein